MRHSRRSDPLTTQDPETVYSIFVLRSCSQGCASDSDMSPSKNSVFVLHTVLIYGWEKATSGYGGRVVRIRDEGLIGFHLEGWVWVKFQNPKHEIIVTNNSVALVRQRTIPTERPPLVVDVSANFLRIEGVAWSLRPRPYSQFSRQEPLFFLSSRSSIVLTRLSEPRSRPTTSLKIW
jgi:hypothetical protein